MGKDIRLCTGFLKYIVPDRFIKLVYLRVIEKLLKFFFSFSIVLIMAKMMKAILHLIDNASVDPIIGIAYV